MSRWSDQRAKRRQREARFERALELAARPAPPGYRNEIRESDQTVLCERCGCLAADPVVHDAWHESLS